MSHQMNPPGPELSYRLLGTVPYGDRLPAGRLMPPVGMLRGDVRSLQELHLLLTPDVRSLPGVNLSALAVWVERVFGDRDLAGALRIAVKEAGSYVDGCLKAYELVSQRLAQAREVAGPKVLT